MAFFALCLSIFVIFFQPEYIFPALMRFQPLKITVIFALLTFFFTSEKSNRPFLSNKINRYFLLFALCQIISSCFIWLHGGVETLTLWLRIGITYFLIVKIVNSIARIKILVAIIVLGIGYLGFDFLLNFVALFETGTYATAFGWWENASDLVLILVVTIPLSVLIMSVSNNLLVRLFFLGLGGLFAFDILFTSSRGGLLGLLIVGLLTMHRTKILPKTLRIILIGLLLGSVVTFGVNNVLNRRDLANNGTLLGDESSENRLIQWEAGIRMIYHNPFFGIGRAQFMDRARDFGGIRGLQPHNTLIQVFSETGIPGGIFFVLFFSIPLLQTLRIVKYFRVRETFPEPGELIFLEFFSIAIIGFWVCAMFSNRYNEYILYILVALIISANQVLSESGYEFNEFGSKISTDNESE